jgi:DNA-directed RNA polymerase subunit M/transcription elongation factor TFIIS
MAGRKGRCARCKSVFRVPGTVQAAALPAPEQAAATPQLVAVYCRVCQTLMYGRLDEVGKTIKCPDCYAQTIVPPPPVVKPPKPMAAMEGEQYELWGVDESPTVAQLLAAQPTYIPIECRLCRTLMHATADQVGKQLKCPDCGTANLVTPPATPVKMPSVLSRDEDDLLIDPTRDPGERPHVIIPPRKPMLYEEEAEAERKLQEERRARGDTRGPQYDARGRAILPRWPLATRILPFLFSYGVLPRWIVLSTVGLMGGSIMLFALSIAMSSGFGAIGGMALYAMALVILSLWFAAISAIVFTIVTESSEGADEVRRWPGNGFSEWLGASLYMLLACLIAPFPGWLIGRVIDPTATAVGFLISLVICLPIVILSQLEGDSAFSVCAPRVVGSVVRMPLTWLMFYAEIALVMAICVGATLAAERVPYLVLLLVPLYVAAILLAARILGRLAWTIAEKMPAREDSAP